VPHVSSHSDVHWHAIVASNPTRRRRAKGVDSGDSTGPLDVDLRRSCTCAAPGGLQHATLLLDRKSRPVLDDGVPVSGPVDHREGEEDERHAGGHQDVAEDVVVHTG
jgi:hypothetical protein